MSSKVNKLVVKDNALINASYTLDLAEQRMILLAVVEAREKGITIDSVTPVTVRADVYAKQFNVSKQTAYEVLKAASSKLLTRRFSFQESRSSGIAEVTSNWVQRTAYLKDTGMVEIMFSFDLVPMITALEKQFTSYELEQVSDLTSIYAVRLYELLIAWRSVGQTPVFELSRFRKQLGVKESEYTRMDNFKSKVLDFAINQINEHTDIIATYMQHKNGRSISGFSFTFIPKKKSSPVSEAEDKSKREKITLSQLVSRHPDETRGKTEAEIFRAFGSKYHIQASR